MNNILLIGFSDMSKLNSGYASWRGEYYSQINEFTDICNLNSKNTPSGIGYLTGRANDNLTCISLLIQDIKAEKNILTVRYSADDEIRQVSSTVKAALREALRPVHGTIMNLPFCAAVDADYIFNILEDEALFLNIKRLKSKNDWAGIFRLFEPVSEIKSKKHIWNSPFMLDNFAFASAKLSETCLNLKISHPDEKARRQFLDKQKKFRELSIEARKRLIELVPDNPGYYSNLGYSYYQSCRELMHPGGRRDGNVITESQYALANIDKALEIDPNRISDNYRKGQILTVLLPPNLLFGKNILPDKDKVEDTRKKISEGIKSFKSAEDIFELIPLIDEKSLNRYFKEYIKSLYCISRAYSALIRSKFNYLSHLGLANGACVYDSYNLREDIKLADFGISYILTCIEKDSGPVKFEKKDLLRQGYFNGAIDGVFKLYSAGKMYLTKSMLLTKSGQPGEATEFLIKSERFLQAALKAPFSSSKINQNKNFVKEKLARAHIVRGGYNDAIKLLKPLVEKRADYYIRYTYALAAFLSGDKTEAVKQINKSLENEKFNKDVSTGKKMLEHFKKDI